MAEIMRIIRKGRRITKPSTKIAITTDKISETVSLVIWKIFKADARLN